MSRYFKPGELLRGSDPETITWAILDEIDALVTIVLDPLRSSFGRAIRVTSGYRDPLKNDEVGGHPTSVHMTGRAADIQPWSFSDKALAQLWTALIRSNIPFDKACLYDGFIHVHISAQGSHGGRRLTYQCLDGKTWVNKKHIPPTTNYRSN
jgi:hypothetical protein